VSNSSFKFVILGGGLTAGYAAQEFADYGIQSGELCIVSAEETLPYERPPLSKKFLAGDKSAGDILINEPSFYEENGIKVKLNHPVSHVNFAEKRLYTNGDTIAYEKLLIATGAKPRAFDLAGSDLANIFYLRQVEDARQIRQAAETAGKAVVIGGGFIGMEVTAVIREAGVETTMLFPEERVWQSFFTPAMSAFFENYYRERGATIIPRQEIDSFEGDDRVSQVMTKTGQRLPADMVVAGIGVTPNSDLFRESGLQMADKGITVNRFLETNLPDVLAAGDVTSYWDVIYERLLHIEHWDNAAEQGRHAARVMLGEYQPFVHVPYFFSDVFDLSFEFWGDTNGAAEIVHRGDIEKGSFSVWWLAENGRLLAAFVMNQPEEERELAPKWIKAGKQLDRSWLSASQSLQPD